MKQRLDVVLAERNLTKSREHARALIMAGQVYVNGRKETKAGTFVAEDADITVKEEVIPFVSRGGLKLEMALKTFPISLTGAVVADIGASTGGFTDCMLKAGAEKVYAIDVGYGQLDWGLRNDNRVAVMERTNARYMEPSWYASPLDFASIDVSFISISKILPALCPCMTLEGQVVSLVKPQFEAGRGKVGKNGVVTDPATHREVCLAAMHYALQAGFQVYGFTFSPIRGPKGNIEFLMWLGKGDKVPVIQEKSFDEIIQQIVEEAHQEPQDL